MTATGRSPGARRLAELAAYATGAISAAGAVGVGVLIGQALLARLTIPGAQAPPPHCDGLYGERYRDVNDASTLRLAVLGDSTAAGYGAATAAQTPGYLLASWISATCRRPVQLHCPAVVGSVSAWLIHQVEAVIDSGVDLAVIFIGANDITTRANEAAAAAYLADAVTALRLAGAEVVVATCPDLGTIAPIRPPLRWLARRWSRQLATAQTAAVQRAGGRAVALGELLGPDFAAEPERMFGADRYHPSADGYYAAAAAVLPAILDALGVGPGSATAGSATQRTEVERYDAQPGVEVAQAR